MSNRGRQNVASFIAKSLSLDWRLGAEYFESSLLDNDTALNYGNWQYNSGVGNMDPRDSRKFNQIKQAKDYDPDGEYVKVWCPELKNVPRAFIHTPWEMSLAEQQACGVIIGRHYPHPMIVEEEWKRYSARPPPKQKAKGSGGIKGRKAPFNHPKGPSRWS